MSRSHCPIATTLEALGDRWSLLVLRDVLMRGKKHYQEFLESEEGISTNILADRLAKLEKLGILSKSPDPASRRRFIYAPTRKGLELLPCIFELAKWGLRHGDAAMRRRPIARRLLGDEEGLRREVLARFG